MEFTDTDKHRASLEVIEETIAYLERLPPVPVTRKFIEKLQAHLDEPTHRLVMQTKRELSGGAYSSTGAPLIYVTVSDDDVHLEIPSQGRQSRTFHGAEESQVADMLAKLLCGGGLTLKLKPKR